MRSHFILNSSTAKACAITGASALLASLASAQIVASDYATDPTYSGGWSAGQNGGTGFGAWSFNYTDATPAGTYQGLNSTPAWTLMANSGSTGLANAGRAITGGLNAGQMFQTIIQNPVNSAGYYTYRGFDMLLYSGSDNLAGGNNTAALRLSVFDYYNAAMNWHINDTGSHGTAVSAITTGASAMIIDFTLNSPTAYTLTMAPVSSPNSPYLTFSGTLASAIDYVDYRDYNTASAGLSDTANNFSISSMSVTDVPEPTSIALVGLGALGVLALRRRQV
jgi:PEP-CTERM motif